MSKKIKKTSSFAKLWYLTKKSFYFAWHRHHFLIPPKAMIKYIRSFFVVLQRGGSNSIVVNEKAYNVWLKEHTKDIKHKKFKYNPLISVVIPVYNVERKYLEECLNSVLNQTYTNFEICIADDNSPNIDTINTLKEYEQKYKNIKVTYRKKNGMISECTNTALDLCKGEFISLLDNDDILEKDALYYVVEALNNNKKLDLIYTDEDLMNDNHHYFRPHFKPDFSPDTLLGVNYICHFTTIRKSIIDEVGKFRKEYDGAQDYDLFLRITEKTKNIYHIPRILYHWRDIATSTAGYLGNKSYAFLNGQKAVKDALKRRKVEAEVLENKLISTNLVKYKHNNPLVSIIIPMKDKAKITKRCLDSIYNKTDYKNFEIILVDNGSVEQKTFDMLKEYEKKDNFKVVRIESEFNYSYLNNEGVKHSKGEYILLLNNDTEVIQSDWLDYMVGYASQEHIGCVGIKLLYPDNKVQHAGVALGYGGVAGHIFVTYSKDDPGLFGRLAMPYNYSAVTAACLLVSRKKFDLVNGLDEKLKVAHNDVDFNLKLLEKGYYNICLSNVTMYHHESKSRGYEDTKEKHERFMKEQAYTKEKWKELIEEDKYFSKYNF